MEDKASFDLCSALLSTRRPLQQPQTSHFRLNAGQEQIDLYLKPASSNSCEVLNTAATPGRNNICLMQISEDRLASTPSSHLSTLENRALVSDAQSDKVKSREADCLPKWFGLPKQKLTPESVRELKAIQLRGVANPKRFFKTTDFKKLPTHFHFATTVESQNKIGESTKIFTRRTKAKSLMSELVNNKQISSFIERKSGKLQAEAKSGGKQWYQTQYRRRGI